MAVLNHVDIHSNVTALTRFDSVFPANRIQNGMTEDSQADESDEWVVRGLGEIAFRVEDLAAMRDFYEGVLGLSVLGDFESAVFYDLGPAHGGHTQVFVLFDRTATDGYTPIDPARTTVDHVALTIDSEDFDAALSDLRSAGLAVDTTYHEWVEWRSLYVTDPEGNRVELVCHDPEFEPDA